MGESIGIEERLVRLVSNKFKRPEELVKKCYKKSLLMNECMFTAIDLVYLYLEIEREFNKKIPYELLKENYDISLCDIATFLKE